MQIVAHKLLRWVLRVAALFAGLALLLLATSPWSVPPLLRRELPRLAQQRLGRVLKVGALQFNPLLLRLRLHAVQLRDPDGRSDALRLAEASVRLGWSSLWGLHPRFDSIRLQGLQLRIVREASGQFDFEDMLRRLQRAPAARSGTTAPAFAVDALQLRDGSVLYVDRGSGLRSHLRDLRLDLTRLSTLGGAPGTLRASAAGRLDGAALQLQLDGPLFGPQARLQAQLQLQRLPLLDWKALQPAWRDVQLGGGTLDASLHLEWPLRATAEPDIGGDLQLHGLQLQRAKQPLLDVAIVDVPLLALRPARRSLQLGVVRIDGIEGRLGPWLLRPAAAAPSAVPVAAGKPAATGAGWQLQLQGLQLQQVQLRWQDASVHPGVDWNFRIPRLQLGAAQWPLAGKVEASGDLLGPRGLELQVQASAAPDSADAQLRLQGLDPRLAQPYAAAWLHGSPLPDGTLQGRLDLRWQHRALQLDVVDAQWQHFRWQPRGAAAGSGPHAQDIRVRQARLDFGRSPRLDLAALDIERPASGRGAGVRAAALQLRNASLDLRQHRVHIGRLQLLQPQLSLARDARGRWSFGSLLPSGLLPRPTTPQQAKAPAARPWRVQVDEASVHAGSAYFADSDAAQPVVLALSGIDLRLRHAGWPLRTAAAFTLQARLRDARQAPRAGASTPGSGLLRLDGTVQGAPWRLQATLHAQGLPAQVAAAYLPAWNLRVLRASASADGRLRLRLAAGGPEFAYAGSLDIGDFAANTRHPDASLLGWQTLQLQRLQLRLAPRAATHMAIGQVLLHHFYARLTLSRDARLNVAQVFAPARRAAARGATAAAPATAARPGLLLRIGGIAVDGGRIDWSDHFVEPNYSASLSRVQGRVGGFASDSPQLATVDLRGIAEGTAPLAISGRINPLLSPPQLDLRGRVDQLQLAPLSPYSVRYAGYGIERGLLSMSVHYAIDPAGKLQAENQLVLRQLSFGPPVHSASATKLPVLLAVNLLKDRNGTIHLDIPISGSLRDPEFNLGSVIAEAVGKLLLRAVTAPFSLMGQLLQGEAPPPQLNVVRFAAGSARVRAEDRAQLADIARLLQAKPQLVVTVTGQACSASEAQAYRQAVLEQQLLAQWKRDAPRAELLAHADAHRVPAADRQRVLAALYRSTALPDKPRNFLGLARSVPDATMERLLQQAIPDGPSHLQALAMRRAVHLRDALNDLGVPAVRQFIAAPLLLGAQQPDCVPSARLSVSLP